MPNLTIDEAFGLALQAHQAGQFAHAESIYRQVLGYQPNNARATYMLGRLSYQVDRDAEAVELIRRAIGFDPNYPDWHNTLGLALRRQGQLDLAIDSYRKAVRLEPRFAEAHFNLGLALKDIGCIEQGVDALRRAADLSGDPRFASAVLLMLHCDPRCDAKQLLAEHVRWNDRFARPLAPPAGFIHSNDRDPNRRLRVGYVSPDLMDHPVGRFMVAPLRHHGREGFEIYCYADVPRPDAVTHLIQSQVDVWRDTTGLPDERLAEMIRGDKIDLLVDLVMHSGAGRPLLFARKPGPVQIAWLAYPGTTGLGAMDYRLTDPYLDRSGAEANYSERSLTLPDIFWCYDPLGDEPAVNALPALNAGHLTFGCLNNFSKCNERVLELWAAVLRNVPDARLLLLAPPGAARQRALSIMQRASVDPGRIEFVPHQPRDAYLKTYHRIDIALDTFPYSGHTTTFDACWMGVPTVSLAGETPVSRGGLSILSNLGLPEWVAATPTQFVEIATRFSRDLSSLSELRRTLRGRMQSSPLMDGARFARGLEADYRKAWRTWCDDTGPSAIRGQS